MDQDRLKLLIGKLQADRLTPAEQSELDAQLVADPEGTVLRSVLEDMMMNAEPGEHFDESHWREIATRLLTVDKAELSGGKNATRTIYFFNSWKWAAAAVITLLLGGGIWMATRQTKPAQHMQVADISAGTNKAVLTLADGSTITLDSAGHQTFQQGNTVLHQQGSQLRYDAGAEGGPDHINTLSTPRCGQFRLELPDGTKAWLNAASSIKYPVAFNSKERNVTITGEVYFEVAQHAGQPFNVQFSLPGTSRQGSVEVLGTSFNINAYADEASVRTTLTSGKVRVHGQADQSAVLEPGQQAVLNNDIQIVSGQAEAALAWKNGLFNFEGMPLQEAMRQLERWYNITVVYEKGVPDIQFFGSLSRQTPLSNVLKALEKSNVRFSQEGNRLIVKP